MQFDDAEFVDADNSLIRKWQTPTNGSSISPSDQIAWIKNMGSALEATETI